MGHADSPLNRLASALARAQDAELDALALPGRGDELVALVARRKRARRVALRAAALVLGLGLIGSVWLRPRPASFALGDGRPGRVAAWISAEAPLPLRFSEGSVVTLAASARARVTWLDEQGARLVLEQGALSARVIHRDVTRWSVAAGPFDVRVTGTRFDVSWSPAAGLFELRLEEGSVTVTGPSLGAERSVRAGEALRVELNPPVPLPAAVAAPASPLSVAPAARTAPSPRARASVPRADGAALDRAWEQIRSLTRAARYGQALQLADASGWSELGARGSASDWLTLADAARFAGDARRTRELLLGLRERFPADAHAATAAFLLGRSAAEQERDNAQAERWFSVYLAEQPAGVLAGDALMRLAETRARGGDAAGAAAAARRYLALEPHGPHAARARRLAE